MLGDLSEAEFVRELLQNQPFIPKYFGYDVALNKAGAPAYAPSVQQAPRLAAGTALAAGVLVVDTRPEAAFKRGHVAGALNIQQGGKFETWLGAIVWPAEPFYLGAAAEATREDLIHKTAKIGYEALIKGAVVGTPTAEATLPQLDVRRPGEFAAGHLPGAVNIDVTSPDFARRVAALDNTRPTYVYCRSGARSATAATQLTKAGFGHVGNLLGGVLDWPGQLVR